MHGNRKKPNDSENLPLLKSRMAELASVTAFARGSGGQGSIMVKPLLYKYGYKCSTKAEYKAGEP